MTDTQKGEKLAYSIPEAAEATSLSKPYLWDLVLKGKLPSVKIGRRRVILKEDLLEFLNRRDAH